MKIAMQYINSKGLPLAEQAMFSGFNFLLSIGITKVLGLEKFGIYSMLFVLVLSVSAIHQAIVVAPLLTLGATQKQPSFINGLFTINLLFVTIAAVFAFVVVSIIPNYLGANINPIVLPIWIVAHCTFDFCRRLGYLKKDYSVTLIATTTMCLLALVSLLIINTYVLLTISNVAIAISTIQLLVSLLLAVYYKLSISFKLKQWIKEVWNFSKFLLANSVVQLFSGNYILIAAGIVAGPTILGLIRIAQNVMGVVNVLLSAIENVAVVSASKIYATQQLKGLKNYLIQVTKKGAAVLVIILVCLAIFSSQILNGLYGQEYAKYGYVLITFCLLYLPIFINTVYQVFIKTTNNNVLIFIGCSISALLSLCFAKPIIATYGIIGVVLGLGLVQLISITTFHVGLKIQLKK